MILPSPADARYLQRALRDCRSVRQWAPWLRELWVTDNTLDHVYIDGVNGTPMNNWGEIRASGSCHRICAQLLPFSNPSRTMKLWSSSVPTIYTLVRVICLLVTGQTRLLLKQSTSHGCLSLPLHSYHQQGRQQDGK